MKNKETEKGKKVSVEMEKLEEYFTAVYDVATHYLCSLKKEQSSETSEILTSNLLNRMIRDVNI